MRHARAMADELVRRIPVYAPEWTDHNASDPGVTLIELFAFLGSQLTVVAVPLQVYLLTRSSLAVGLVGLAQLGPLFNTANSSNVP